VEEANPPQAKESTPAAGAQPGPAEAQARAVVQHSSGEVPAALVDSDLAVGLPEEELRQAVGAEWSLALKPNVTS